MHSALCQQPHAEHNISPVHCTVQHSAFSCPVHTAVPQPVPPHGSPHLACICTAVLPHLPGSPVLAHTVQPQLRASIALAAPGCPLVKYPTHHRAALHQQQKRTGAASGQQHSNTGDAEAGKKQRKVERGRRKKIRAGKGPCGYCHVPICFKSCVLRLFLNGQR